MEETAWTNALREMQEAVSNFFGTIGEAMGLIADAFPQVIGPVLDAIQAIEAAEAARVYAAANRRELHCMTRAKKLRVRKKYYNRVKKRIARRREIKA